jgi:hypothetical protein
MTKEKQKKSKGACGFLRISFIFVLMNVLKLTIYLLCFCAFAFACSQADSAQCACLNQAQKVNRLAAKIWNEQASRQDSLLLKAALTKKDKLCKALQEAAPESVQKLKSTCPQ